MGLRELFALFEQRVPLGEYALSPEPTVISPEKPLLFRRNKALVCLAIPARYQRDLSIWGLRAPDGTAITISGELRSKDGTAFPIRGNTFMRLFDRECYGATAPLNSQGIRFTAIQLVATHPLPKTQIGWADFFTK